MYNPNAIVICLNGEPEVTSLCGYVKSIDEAKNQLYIWQDKHELIILSWWIENELNETVEQGLCLDNAGQLIDLYGKRISLKNRKSN